MISNTTITPLKSDSTDSSGGIHHSPFPKLENNHLIKNGPNSHNTNANNKPKRILRCMTGLGNVQAAMPPPITILRTIIG